MDRAPLSSNPARLSAWTWGLSSLLACSDGMLINNPRWLRRSLAKLRRAQRALARKTRSSSRWWQCKRRVEALYWKVANQRRDFLHRLTYGYDARVCTDPPLKRYRLALCLPTRPLALSASDASWSPVPLDAGLQG